MAECPFCRTTISGREEQLLTQRRHNREWQLDQDAFAIQQNDFQPIGFLQFRAMQDDLHREIQREIMVDLQSLRLRQLVLSLWDEN